MTSELLISEDIFDPTVPDEEMELGALEASLRLAKGFALLYARCNQPEQRRRLVSELRKRLPELKIQEIEFHEPITHLLDQLRSHIEDSAPDVVFLYGLENSLPVADQAAKTPFVANLNASRNSFPRYVPCPLVLWVPEYVLTAILHGAPDFFSVLSGVYYFASTPSQTHEIRQNLLSGEQWRIASLPLSEKLERVATIDNLLADYRSLPTKQRDLQAEATLLHSQANYYIVLGWWNKAEIALSKSLSIFYELHDSINQTVTLNNLASVYRHQEHWKDALDVYIRGLILLNNMTHPTRDTHIVRGLTLFGISSIFVEQIRLEEALEALRQSLDLMIAFQEEEYTSKILDSVAGIYLRQKNFGAARLILRECLVIARQSNNTEDEGRAYFQLGNCAVADENFKEAEYAFQQSLAIRQKSGDKIGEQQTYFKMGGLYAQQSRWDEAEQQFQNSLIIQRDIGDTIGEGMSLEGLAVMQLVRGKILEAMQLAQEAILVLEPFQDRREYQRICEMIKNLQHHLELESEENS